MDHNRCGIWAGLVITSLAASLHGQIIIEPAYVEVNLDKGRPTGQFVITNSGDAPCRYRVLTSHFTFSREGLLRRQEPDETSLASWLTLNPREFTLPGKSRRAVRFVLVPPPQLPEGEYWGAVELESLDEQVGTGADAGGRVMRVRVISSIMVPVFAVRGQVRYTGRLTEVRSVQAADGRSLEALVINDGSGRLRIQGEFELHAGGSSVAQGRLARTYVLPSTEQYMRGMLPGDLPAGQYTARIRLTCDQLSAPLTLETSVMVPAALGPSTTPGSAE